MSIELFTVRKISLDAIIPSRGSEGAAGYDLHTLKDGIISPYSIAIIPTGINITIPSSYYAGIFGRSGLAIKHGLEVIGDNVYNTGEINVKIFNNRNISYEYKKGDRIAQMVFIYADGTPIEIVDQLDGTDRGVKGFGSTGI